MRASQCSAPSLSCQRSFWGGVLREFASSALSATTFNISPEASWAAFITAPFSEDRNGINPDVLATAVHYIPNSARLNQRLAEYEVTHGDAPWADAEFHARRAIALSPHNYEPLLTLASVFQAREDAKEAEASVRAALRLAPGNLPAHWQLANVLVDENRLEDAIPEFKIASDDRDYFQAARDLVWEKSGHDAQKVIDISPASAKHKLTIANFLLQESRPLESVQAFRQANANELLSEADSGAYLDGLINAGHVTIAHDAWHWLMGHVSEGAQESANLVRNGGFESDILVQFAQFDWSLSPNKFAKISIDDTAAHSGSRSLRLDFLGQETTKLENEISQLLVLKAGARYKLSYWQKTDKLLVSQGPQVVISPRSSGEWITSSTPLSEGSGDWRHEVLEFTAPVAPIVLSIKLKPKFSYEEPARGSVWYDDFEITCVD